MMTREQKQAKYGTGPWLDEPDHVQFEAHGFPCLIHRNPLGAWCGYVGVPPEHPAHGKDYDDVAADVHGGLTYAQPCQGEICHVAKPGEPDNVWWLGFDCAHSGDKCPSQSSDPFFNMFRSYEDNDVYRDQEYVTAETTSLAEQLRAAAGPAS